MLRPPLGQLLKFTLARIWYPLLLLPVALLFGLLYAFNEWRWNVASKDWAEVAAFVILLPALATGLWRWYRRRDAFLAWLTAFVAAFVFREIHIDGTTDAIYLAMLALMLLAWWRYAWFAGYLASRVTLTLLSGSLFTYFVALGCDKNVWTFATADIKLLQHVEEFIELAGHLQVLLLSLLARAAANPLMPGNARK